MIKAFLSIIFTFFTLYSPLASIGHDLHLLDHEQHHLSETKHQHDEPGLLNLVSHENNEESEEHRHVSAPENAPSKVKADQFSLFGPQVLFTYQTIILHLLRESTPKQHAIPVHRISYRPPPHQFRNLPLLN